MDAIEREFQRSKRNSEVMEAFGFRLHNQFSLNKAYRRPKELEWLESLRQYKGLYDPDVVIEKNASKAYPKITRSKVNIVLSRLWEMLFPENDKNFEIQPTPDPTIAKEIVREIAISLIQPPAMDPKTGQVAIDPQTGRQAQPTLPTEDDLRIAIWKFARDTCEKMSTVIDDQLTEMDYSGETKKVLRSGLLYGTGVMKGPMISKRTARRWKPVNTMEGIDYEEETKTQEVPLLEFVRIWDWYPDMSITDLDKIEGSFERHIMTKHDLRQLMKRDDFYSDIIEDYLEAHPDGDYVPENWEVDLQVIEVEAGSGKDSKAVTGYQALDQSGRSTYRQLGKKYETPEFWGYVDGRDLEACGLNITDSTIEYAANVWLLGKHVIKTALYSMALDQYKVFYYEKDETSIFGEGLPRIMRHSQIAIAAGARMVLDNGACVAGPQVEVNWSLMTPGTDYSSFYARKIWYREGKGIDAQYPALRVYNIDSHVDELLKIVDAFKQFGDEETTLPTWMIGQMVNNETAQATSGRMATITVSIKDVVKNFDSFTEHIIRDVYAWNMDFNPRKDIKGDFKVKARGVSSLVMKEIRMQALAQLTATMTPAEWDYIPEREFLQEKFKAHDINIRLLSEEEVAQKRQAREESVQNQLMIEMQKSEIAKNKAQSMSLLTKAKDKNIEALRKANEPLETVDSDDPRLVEAELATLETENEGKKREIDRQDEEHVLDLQQKIESHDTKMAIDTSKAARDIAIKQKVAEEGIKAKKTLTAASVKAKIISAKKKPSKSVKKAE